MLAFAFFSGLAGLSVCSVMWGLVVAGSPLAAEPSLYIALFLGIFAPFICAIAGHPAREISGTTVSVELGPVLRTAAWWTIVLSGLVMWAFFMAVSRLPGDHFTVDAASLAGRPDRQQVLIAITALFHSFSVMIASSGMRWGTSRAWPWPLNIVLGPSPGLGAIRSQGNLLRFRAIDGMSWWGLLLELGVCLYMLYQTRPWVGGELGWVRYSFGLVPLAHFLAAAFSHTTVGIEGDRLRTRVFPLWFLGKKLPLEEIKGIQVYRGPESPFLQGGVHLAAIGQAMSSLLRSSLASSRHLPCSSSRASSRR